MNYLICIPWIQALLLAIFNQYFMYTLHNESNKPFNPLIGKLYIGAITCIVALGTNLLAQNGID